MAEVTDKTGKDQGLVRKVGPMYDQVTKPPLQKGLPCVLNLLLTAAASQ